MRSLKASTRFFGIGLNGRLFIVYARTAKAARLLFREGNTWTAKGLVPIEVDETTVTEYRLPEWEPEGVVYDYHKSGALP